jgi:peptidoglycan/LPS O-acetylase OafA/YrhL
VFGTYRTLLAIAVVATHFGGVKGFGLAAVFGFYSLSGFLMTLLVTGPYRGRRKAFLLNRFLRLYPLYWAVIALTLFLLWLHNWAPFGRLGVPSWLVLLRQMAFVNWSTDKPTLNNISWAVTNELIFYVLIALGISATLKRSLIWLGVSVGIVITSALFPPTPLVVEGLYFFPRAASLPFAVGATLYHLSDFLTVLPTRRLAVLGSASAVMVILMILTCASFEQRDFPIMMLWTYVSLLPAGMIILSLFSWEQTELDDQMGRFSYPIYLAQYPGAMALLLLGMVPGFWGVMAATLAISALFLAFIDAPIQRLRQKIRPSRDRCVGLDNDIAQAFLE